MSSNDEANIISELLEGESPSSKQFADAIPIFEDVAQEARSRNKTELAKLGELLVKLLEFGLFLTDEAVDCPDSESETDQDLVRELIGSIRESLDLIIGTNDDAELDEKLDVHIQKIKEKWEQYVEFDDQGLTESSDSDPMELEFDASVEADVADDENPDEYDLQELQSELAKLESSSQGESDNEEVENNLDAMQMMLSVIDSNEDQELQGDSDIKPDAESEFKNEEQNENVKATEDARRASQSQELESSAESPAATTPAATPIFSATESDLSAGLECPKLKELPAEIANDAELLEAFLDDGSRCLSSMEQATLTLESSPNHNESLAQFSRELHTLKGASASVGLSDLATYLHQVESGIESSSGQIEVDFLLSAVDATRDHINDIKRFMAPGLDEEPGARSMSNEPMRESSSFLSSNSEASIRIRASQLDRLMDMLGELVVLRNRRDNHISILSQIDGELSRCATRLQFADEVPTAFYNSRETIDSYQISGSNTFIEVANDITEISRNLKDLHKPVAVDNTSISQFIRHFRQELMALRRLPVVGLMNRLQRAARDAAKTEEKKIEVELIGEEVGLEQEIQELLYEPMLHMVRNSVSHGIENPVDRQLSKKPEAGKITIETQSSMNRIVIEIRDDGRGLDYTAIRRRAIENGLINSSHSTTEQELSQLIFHPGFSTKQETSEISGRGVGMDIVSTSIKRLHGRLDVESVFGQGTTMRISIPLRSGIEHAMVFRIGNQLFALPMHSVSAAQNAKNNPRNTLINSLSEILNTGSQNGENSKNESLLLLRNVDIATSNTRNREPSERLGVLVDEIVGPEEVVVRSLPPLLSNHPLFCGVALSGGGESVLFLDGERLAEVCRNQEHKNNPIEPIEDKDKEDNDARRVLVVDDSLSVRKSMVKSLHKLGFVTVEAGDGLQALEKMRIHKFALVMTDLDMPRLGGLEVLRDMETGHYGNAPVIVVSSRHEDEFRSRAIDAGAVDYLSKPVNEKSLVEALSSLDLLSNQLCLGGQS